MQVFFTIGLAVAFAGDRLQRHNVLGAAIAAAGVVVLAAYKLTWGLSGTFVGFALVIARGLRLGRAATSSPSAAPAITAPTCSRWSSGRASSRRCRSPRFRTRSRAARRSGTRSPR